MARTIKTTLPKKDLKKFIRDIPGMLAGTKPSRFGITKLFWGAIGYSVFQSISDAFEAKSFGLPDELGNEWNDLTQHYKAYKRPLMGGDLPQNLKRRMQNKSTLGLLTPGEYARWKKIFGTMYHWNKDKIPDSDAKAFAGQVAWTRLKEEGAKTKWKELGERNVLINRITDRLYLSLVPGNFDSDSGYSKNNRNQVFVISKGTLTLGTKVPYANLVSKTRPLWPEDIDKWLSEALDFATTALTAKIERIIK